MPDANMAESKLDLARRRGPKAPSHDRISLTNPIVMVDVLMWETFLL
jgi:hypothetical protein